MWEIYLIFIPNKKKKKVKWWEKRVTCHYRRWEVAWLGDRSRLELWPPCPSSKWSWAELDSINNLSLSLSLFYESLSVFFFSMKFLSLISVSLVGEGSAVSRVKLGEMHVWWRGIYLGLVSVCLLCWSFMANNALD